MLRVARIHVLTLAALTLLLTIWLGPSTIRGQADSSEEKHPIDLTKAKRGSCQSGELESERGCVLFPKVAKKVPPKYPDDARRRHRDGSVTMSVTVDQAGAVMDTTVTGSLPKNLGFEEAAVTAVRQWQYKPALLAGEPVATIIEVRIDFSVSR